MTTLVRAAPAARRPRPVEEPVIEASGVGRRFGKRVALADVSLRVAAGEIRALLGPNGAGKTTLLRILAGLVAPSEGDVRVFGVGAERAWRARRALVGLVPAGDRSFYLRLSGLENLVFFARLHGMPRKSALTRAREVLEWVDLGEASRQRVGEYSHGMQKRLSVARGILTEPRLLLVDEATHDLDPDGARRVRALVSEIAGGGTAVVWATQRLDEIRGFADRVTLLGDGKTRFDGTVAELVVRARPRRYVVQLDANGGSPLVSSSRLEDALGSLATIAPVGAGGAGLFLLTLSEEAVLGDALVALACEHVQVLACRHERSEVEEAFFSLLREETP